MPSISAATAIPNGSPTAPTRSRFRRRCAGAGRYAGRARGRAAGRGRRLARRHRLLCWPRAVRSGRSAATCSPPWCWSTSRRGSTSRGVDKVQGFMRAHAKEGFGSIAEAADAVAAYLPHRPRPRSHEGLKKNLRLHPDGRWRWHWDPRFLDGQRRVGPRRARRSRRAGRGRAADHGPGAAGARRLLRAGAGGACARSFSTWSRTPTYVDVSGARHMVAGDRNDQFATAIRNSSASSGNCLRVFDKAG